MERGWGCPQKEPPKIAPPLGSSSQTGGGSHRRELEGVGRHSAVRKPPLPSAQSCGPAEGAINTNPSVGEVVWPTEKGETDHRSARPGITDWRREPST